jgi:integrase/recombinase XerD
MKAKSKIETVLPGMRQDCYNLLISIDETNAATIVDYVLAYKHEKNPSESTLTNAVLYLGRFVRQVRKGFQQMTRDDILKYMDSFRKSETEDPLHKWIGTRNLFRIIVMHFFKWLYHPNLDPKERSKPEYRPDVIKNISKLRRKEESIYKPIDLWNDEDNRIFLKYCPSARLSCYHSMAADTGARPHELLKQTIGDIVWPPRKQYGEILVNGKTGTRSLKLTYSVPFVKKWIEQHPQRANASAVLISSRKGGGVLDERSLATRYKITRDYFKKLLDTDIETDDKEHIRLLLKKRWNPYNFRHSGLTSLSKEPGMNEPKLRQWAGWTPRSNMPSVYIHYFGDEAGQTVLKNRGFVEGGEQQKQQSLALKKCPVCGEPNSPVAPFCVKCRIPTAAGYLEEREKKDQEIQELKEQMSKMGDVMKKLDSSMRIYRNEFMSYVLQFGHPFTGKDRERLEAFIKQIETDA